MQAALSLQDWLPAELYRLLLVFCRVSTALMLLPGTGEGGLPARIRVITGLLIALCIAPLAGPAIPMPGPLQTVGGIAVEAAAGALLGTLSRILLSAVQMAGQVIGQSIGISNAFAFGIGMDNSAVLGAALYSACLAALFAMDGHHPGLRAIADSYSLVPLGTPPPAAASARAIAAAVAAAFRMALQLSLPFLLLAMIFNVALAGINRALPAMPVFMIGAPALLMAGLHLLEVTAPTVLNEMLGAYADVFVLGR